jgi:hypothetical protein
VFEAVDVDAQGDVHGLVDHLVVAGTFTTLATRHRID